MQSDPEAYNEYMRNYMTERYRSRMAFAHKQLGGKCARCGSADDLELDHIDPSTKEFVIAKKAAGVSEVRFLRELAKCQLLCKTCHELKSIVEMGKQPIGDRHGTISMATHRRCRCEPCLEVRRRYNREGRARRTAASLI